MGCGQGVKLERRRLVTGRHSGIADQHSCILDVMKSTDFPELILTMLNRETASKG